MADFTPMETAALYGVFRGLTYAKIAREAGITPSTVKWHIHNAAKKAGLSSLAMICLPFRDDAVRAAAIERLSRLSTRVVWGRRSRLCPSEERVLDRVLLGESNHQICASLDLSISTVKTHLSHIYRAILVYSRRELIACALSLD